MSTDIDSPWKEALDEYLEPCFDLLFPFAHAEIDWSKKAISLDKELQKVAHDAEVGRRYVDKLYQVHLKNGDKREILLHVELQAQRDRGFEERMFVYNYRAYDQKHQPVASFAILADDEPNWRPIQFGWTILGCTHTMKFVPAKLLDWAPRWQELETHPNLFAKVVLAHLKMMETRNDSAARFQWKIRFVQALYDQGLSEPVVLKLFRFIDWLMYLPPALEGLFWRQVHEIQEARHMPFMTTPERVGRREGLWKGIRVCLKLKFGEAGLVLMPEIEQVYELDQLETILDSIESAAKPENLRRLWTPQSR
jgi:hypothetical protein